MPAADILAIERLLRDYAAFNDAGHWEEAAALFVDDGVLVRPSDPSRPIVGRPAILAAFLARPRTARRRHVVSIPEVSFTGEHTARATCETVLVTDHDDGTGTIALGGFRDELVRDATGWRFRSRIGYNTLDPVPWPARRTA